MRSRQKLIGWHNTVFISLWAPESGHQRAARAHRHHWPRNYAAVVASDLVRYQLFGHSIEYDCTAPVPHPLLQGVLSMGEDFEILIFFVKVEEQMRAVTINCEFSLPCLTGNIILQLPVVSSKFIDKHCFEQIVKAEVIALLGSLALAFMEQWRWKHFDCCVSVRLAD